MRKLGMLLALAGILAGCGKGARLSDCLDDPGYHTLVSISGDMGRLGGCQVHQPEFALALVLRVGEGVTLTLDDEPWTPDDEDFYWLDLVPYLVELNPQVARSFSEPVDEPIDLSVTVTRPEGEAETLTMTLDVGSILWNRLFLRLEEGITFPAPSTDGEASLMFIDGAGGDPRLYGVADRIADITYVALAHNVEGQSVDCGYYVSDDGLGGGSLTVQAYDKEITIYDPHTGVVLETRTFTTPPDQCPTYTYASTESTYAGESTYLPWIESYLSRSSERTTDESL